MQITKGFRLVEMNREAEVLAIYTQFTGHEGLPPFLFEKPEERRVVLGCFEGERPIGLSFGVVSEEKHCFFFHHISLGKGYARKSILLWYTEAVFAWVLERYQIQQVMIEIRQPEATEPAYLEILKKASHVQVKEVVYVYQASLPTAEFAQLRKKRWYCPWLLEQKGYEAIPVDDCGPQAWQKVRQAEEAGQTEGDYLSPGLWEDHMDYDRATSFALVKKGETRPLGWIVTEKKGDTAVLLRRFYIYKEERKKRLGPAFSTWALDEIEKRYEYLSYEVVKGNRQMEMFMQCYCKPYLVEDDCKCRIVLTVS